MTRPNDADGVQMALPIGTKPKVAWAPSSDDDTSLEAAAKASRSGRTRIVLMQVLDAIAAEPATDQQLEQRLNIPGNTVRPRRRQLELDGLVEHSGEYRPTASGRRSKVYRVTPEGRAAATSGDTHG